MYADACRGSERGAFLRVRVTGDVGPTGYLVVYLPSGTQLVLRERDLLRFDTGAEPSPSTATTDLDHVAEIPH